MSQKILRRRLDEGKFKPIEYWTAVTENISEKKNTKIERSVDEWKLKPTYWRNNCNTYYLEHNALWHGCLVIQLCWIVHIAVHGSEYSGRCGEFVEMLFVDVLDILAMCAESGGQDTVTTQHVLGCLSQQRCGRVAASGKQLRLRYCLFGEDIFENEWIILNFDGR